MADLQSKILFIAGNTKWIKSEGITAQSSVAELLAAADKGMKAAAAKRAKAMQSELGLADNATFADLDQFMPVEEEEP